MKNKTDVAIRKNYFEDTIVLLGDFVISGHNMNYVLRLSYYGSKTDKQRLRVYFALLDDTKREYSEVSQEYEADEIIIDENHLLIRADKFEIRDSDEGLKVYIDYDTIVFEYIIKCKGDKIDIKKFGKSNEGGKVETYTYPECYAYGHATVFEHYTEISGNVFYIRHSQSFDKPISRLFFGKKSVLESNSNFMFCFFKLSDDRKLMVGSFNSDELSTDQLGVVRYGELEERDIEPLRKPMMEYLRALDNQDKILQLNINAFNNSFKLKCKTRLNKNENLSPEDPNFKMYDKFVRCSGVFDGEKVSGYGYLVLF
ncbi:MAG: hypothetical protein K6C35_05260 [Eubacterium sp.]|nr:hypothetical protein [Eubacterium sp.]